MSTAQATATPQVNSVGDFFGQLLGGGFQFLGTLGQLELEEERLENQMRFQTLNAQLEAAAEQERIDASRRNTAVEAAQGSIGTGTMLMIGGGLAAVVALMFIVTGRR